MSELADHFGTPLFVFDAEEVRSRYRRLKEAIDHRPLRLHYSLKAHANVAILRLLARLGAGVDACSVGDLAFAHAAGFEPERISFTACGLSDRELRAVLASRAFFIADSLDQMERYGRLAGGSSVGLRVNIGVEAGFHPHVRAGGRRSKFGIQTHQLDDAVKLAKRLAVRITWIHAHVGSDIVELEPLLEVVDRLLAAGRVLSDLQAVDVGGGWGVPFDEGGGEVDLAAYGRAVTQRLAAHAERTGQLLTLVLEPGAFLMQAAGYLITRVTEIKPATAFNGVTTPHFAFVDANCGQLISSLLYGTSRRIRAVGGVGRPTQTYDVCGNLMQAGDVLAQEVELPGLAKGDVLLVEDAGSYCACRTSTFNERPRPAEAIVEAGAARLIRRAESVADLISSQLLEDY